jgi:hypothetical protein
VSRTITVTDDDSGVVTTVVVAKGDGGFPTVKEIRFTTLNGGGGLEKLDLSVLRDFGLTDQGQVTPAPTGEAQPKPEPKPEPKSQSKPEAEPAPEPVPAAKATGSARRRRGGAKPLVRKRPAAGGREYRRAPAPDELKRLFAEHGGSSGVARALDVPAHSVAGWLRRYRNDGHVFESTVAA